MNPIEIHYTLTLSQYMAACAAHWKAHRQGTLTQFLVGSIGVGVGLATIKFVAWPPISYALVAMGVAIWMVPILRSWLYRRAYREAKKYTENIHATFTTQGIHIESAEGKSDLKWSFYSKYLNARDYVLLYMTRQSFSVIPKSAFADESEAERFIRLVDANLERTR
jgi:hypothetical protein